MSLLRRASLWLLPSLLRLVLVLLAVSFALAITFGSPGRITSSLDESGVYDTILDEILAQSQEQLGEKPGNIPLNGPEIQRITNEAFTPEFLRTTTTELIDNIYAWLEGDSEKLEFKIDLESRKLAFAEGIAGYAVQRAEALPPCTSTAQLQANANASLFNLTCLPQGVNLATERQRVIQEITSSDEFLGETTISSDTLSQDMAFQEISRLPLIYQWVQRLPWILVFTALLLIASFWALSNERRRAIRIIAVSLAATGAFTLIAILVLRYMVDQSAGPVGLPNLRSQPLTPALSHLAGNFYDTFIRWVVGFSIAYIFLGLIVLSALKIKAKSVTRTSK